MLNDNLVNFYMNYLLSTYIEDQLSTHNILIEDALSVLSRTPLPDPSQEEHIKATLNHSLLQFYMFSTFLYPQLSHLRRVDNQAAKEKLFKWCEMAGVFQRQCVFFPIYQSYEYDIMIMSLIMMIILIMKMKMKMLPVRYSVYYKP